MSRRGKRDSASDEISSLAPTSVKATLQPSLQRAVATPSVLERPAQPAAHFLHVLPKSVESDVDFRTNAAPRRKAVNDTIGEERSTCETVPSKNIDLSRSQAEACNSRVNHFDSSASKTGSGDAALSASRFSKTNNAFQMFSSTEN